jgi:hypothetical protein
MAWRFDQAVIRGELDNTERGRVTVRLEVVDRAEPILLDLQGDAWRDIAGSRLVFINPSPRSQPAVPPGSGVQTGQVGDITASRKVKVFAVPEDQWKQAYRERRIHEVPTEIRSCFYLEWFTEGLGRCVVESTDFQIEVAEHRWQMDEDEEAAQRMANLHAMREHLAAVIQRPPRDEAAEYDDELRQEDFTEDKWEEQLKASDRLTDASLEAHDKYEEDEESEQKIAFVMGWDHLIADLADAQEGVEPSARDFAENQRRREWMETLNQDIAEDLDPEAEDGGRLDEATEGAAVRHKAQEHPLGRQARELVVRICGEARRAGLGASSESSPDDPLTRFLGNIMQVSGKLAAAIGVLGRRPQTEIDIDTGYALAVSKRCLNWINEALAALHELETSSANACHEALLGAWRKDLFSLREGIVDFRRSLRGN